MPHFDQIPFQHDKPMAPAQMLPRAMPTEKSELAELIDRVDRLLSLLEPPSTVIISGQRAVDEYERLITEERFNG